MYCEKCGKIKKVITLREWKKRTKKSSNNFRRVSRAWDRVERKIEQGYKLTPEEDRLWEALDGVAMKIMFDDFDEKTIFQKLDKVNRWLVK